MGIRFACNLCEHSLNIKRDLAGKIGVCPHCRGKIRIPLDDAPRSEPLVVSSTTAVSVEGSATLDTIDSESRQTTSPLDEPGAQWFVRPPAGGQYGPASGEVLRTWITENRVTGSTLIWRDGWSQWRSARETLPELAETTHRSHPANVGNANSGGNANDLFDDPLLAQSPIATQPSANTLIGDASIGQHRSGRNQRRMMLIIALGLLSVLLIATLVVLALRT